MLAALILFVPLPARAAHATERLIRVDASQFSYSPGEVRVNEGDVVTIELASQDVVHGIYIDGYDLSVTADPGQPAKLTFTADRPGMFRFRCNVTCGPMHPFMIGKLVVGGNALLARTTAMILLAGLSVIFFPRIPAIE